MVPAGPIFTKPPLNNRRTQRFDEPEPAGLPCTPVGQLQAFHTSKSYTVKERRVVPTYSTSRSSAHSFSDSSDLDYNCKDLKKQGYRGSLFKITLVSHGYTFVGKATRDVYVPNLQHEGRIYDRLKSIQGKIIPVYLGNIDLDPPWRDLHVRLIHMLLMSWGGEKANKVKRVGNLNMEIKRFENVIEQLGVRHNDIIPDNIL